MGVSKNPVSLLPVETDTHGWETPKGSAGGSLGLI